MGEAKRRKQLDPNFGQKILPLTKPKFKLLAQVAKDSYQEIGKGVLFYVKLLEYSPKRLLVYADFEAICDLLYIKKGSKKQFDLLICLDQHNYENVFVFAGRTEGLPLTLVMPIKYDYSGCFEPKEYDFNGFEWEFYLILTERARPMVRPMPVTLVLQMSTR